MQAPPLRSIWSLIDAVSVLFSQAYMAARARAFGHPSPVVRLLAQRDHAYSDGVLLERELEIFRSQRHRYPAKRRPHFAPQERAEILQLKRLRGWSAKETAERFAVHPNTIRNWQRAVKDKHRVEGLIGAPPWNKLHAGIRWLVHEIRRLCPERDFGTRTITRHLLRAGIQISRSSVRRILEEDPEPRTPKSADSVAPISRTAPDHFFNPPEPHRVWHMDLTGFRVLWRRYEVAAILDGYSRKVLALQAYRGTPGTDDLVRLVDKALAQHKRPRFLVSDRGGQFQRRFRLALHARGIRHARGRARTWQFNAKVERLFWSLKRWWRWSLITPRIERIQRRLDAYRTWHNLYRPHAAHDRLTPLEAERKASPIQPIRFVEGGEFQPEIRLERKHVDGDPRLLYPVIKVTSGFRSAA